MRSNFILISFCSAALFSQQSSRPDIPWSRLEAAALREVQADCPVDELNPGDSGSVIVRLVVGPDGKVKTATPVVGTNELREAAVKAISQWQFKPQIINGKATEVESSASVDVCGELEDSGSGMRMLVDPTPIDREKLKQLRDQLPFFQIAKLADKCGMPTYNEESCTRGEALLAKLRGPESAIARGLLDRAEGDLKWKVGDAAAAEAIWKRSLPLLRKDTNAIPPRMDLVYRLGLLYDRQKRYEDSLTAYKEQEEIAITVERLKTESAIPHTVQEKAEAAEGGKIMMQDALEGQLRALVALDRPKEAEEVRKKLARLK